MMDDRIPEPGKPPNLRVAVRRARVESADQSEALESLRHAEAARLALIEDAIRPVFDEIPDDIDVFDLGLTHGERPRLFLDMVAFIDMAHDRRTYRFFQDTRHGRVLIAESESADRILEAVTNYVARRLVEREQALTTDWKDRTAPPPLAPAAPARVKQSPKLADRAAALANGSRWRDLAEQARVGASRVWPPRGFSATRAMETFGFVLMTLGSMALCLLIYLAAQTLWLYWLRPMFAGHG